MTVSGQLVDGSGPRSRAPWWISTSVRPRFASQPGAPSRSPIGRGVSRPDAKGPVEVGRRRLSRRLRELGTGSRAAMARVKGAISLHAPKRSGPESAPRSAAGQGQGSPLLAGRQVRRGAGPHRPSLEDRRPLAAHQLQRQISPAIPIRRRLHAAGQLPVPGGCSPGARVALSACRLTDPIVGSDSLNPGSKARRVTGRQEKMNRRDGRRPAVHDVRRGCVDPSLLSSLCVDEPVGSNRVNQPREHRYAPRVSTWPALIVASAFRNPSPAGRPGCYRRRSRPSCHSASRGDRQWSASSRRTFPCENHLARAAAAEGSSVRRVASNPAASKRAVAGRFVACASGRLRNGLLAGTRSRMKPRWRG